jgi:hypothetical protein
MMFQQDTVWLIHKTYRFIDLKRFEDDTARAFPHVQFDERSGFP